MNKIHTTCVFGTDGFSFTKDNPRIQLKPMGIILGDNNYFAPFVSVDNGIIRDTQIGNNNIFDTHVHISHDCIIGNNCEIDTNAILLGGVVIGNNVRICTGAIVHSDITIGDGSVLGANSYLRHDLPSDVIAYGSPALPKENTKYGKYLRSLK